MGITYPNWRQQFPRVKLVFRQGKQYEVDDLRKLVVTTMTTYYLLLTTYYYYYYSLLTTYYYKVDDLKKLSLHAARCH